MYNIHVLKHTSFCIFIAVKTNETLGIVDYENSTGG
jgi:hypothetical protein